MVSKTIHFISLGCAKNRVDSEIMLGVGDRAGYQAVPNPEDAQVIVVNTCGFIGPAKKESIDAILEMGALKEHGRCEKLVVAGCLSQRYPDALAGELVEVDHFLGSSDMLKLDKILQDDPVPRVLVGNPADFTMRASDPRRLSEGVHSAYIKIAEGCNRTCSFCAIPSIRGRQRSRQPEDIESEVRRLVDGGLVEANLVSQDTVAYGRDLPARPTLVQLVRRLAEIDGLRWIRLHYLYPEVLRDELFEVFSRYPNVLPYIDMPLQHASDSILRRMRRGHGGMRLRNLLERVRQHLPNAVLRTTFIVGHPGETDDDFEQLCDFVSWAEFDHVGVFRYSGEEGTRSAQMSDCVPAKVAAQRQRRLLSLQRRISRAKQRRLIGSTMDVLVEGVSEESEFLLQGRWWGQAREVDGTVILANGQARVGQLRKAVITAASDYDVVADLLDAEGQVDRPAGAVAPPRRKRLPMVGARV